MPAHDEPNKQQLQRMAPKHEAILNFIVANPQASRQDIAAYFEVSANWITIVMGSDAFKARLRERQDEVFSGTVMDLRDKLEGVAHQGVERLGEAVENSTDPKFLLEATDKVLHRLGYAPRGPGNHSGGTTNIQQNTVVMTDPAQLEQARELMERARALRASPQEEPPAIEHNNKEHTADAGEPDNA